MQSCNTHSHVQPENTKVVDLCILHVETTKNPIYTQKKHEQTNQTQTYNHNKPSRQTPGKKKQTITIPNKNIPIPKKTYWWVVTHCPSPSQFIFLTQTRLVSQAHPFWQGLWAILDPRGTCTTSFVKRSIGHSCNLFCQEALLSLQFLLARGMLKPSETSFAKRSYWKKMLCNHLLARGSPCIIAMPS